MMHDLRVGDTLVDRWTIQRIFTGGMGIVYVLHESTHEWLAAKTFQHSVFEKTLQLLHDSNAKPRPGLPCRAILM